MKGRNASPENGFTLVEFLIATAVMLVILSIAGIFLAQQARLQRSTQLRSELQDRVRTSMQLVTQDLALAGNSSIIDGSGRRLDIVWPGCFDGASGCVEVEDAGQTLRVRYLSSQFTSGNECRDVTYSLDGSGVILRSDVLCGGSEDFVELSSDIVNFASTVNCSNGSGLTAFPSSGCPPILSYGRSVTVDILGRSTVQASGESMAGCPSGYVCFGMTQETLVPNMKDQ